MMLHYESPILFRFQKENQIPTNKTWSWIAHDHIVYIRKAVTYTGGS
jgi:hypothetical protein